MLRAVGVAVCLTAVLAGGCASRRELVVEPNEAMCQVYGITAEDINDAVVTGPRDVRRLGQTVVKVLPDGTVIRLRRVASLRHRERKER